MAFLKKCQKEKLTPVSHRIKVKKHIPPSVTRKAEAEYIADTIKRHYAKLDKLTLKCYSLHLKLANEYPEGFPLFLTKVKRAEECEADRKRRLHKKKLTNLRNETRAAKDTHTPIPMVQPIEGFVVNRSTQQFTEEQLTHLNKGLGYAVTSKPDVEQIIVDMETAITQNVNIKDQNTARNIVADAIKTGQRSKVNSDETRIVTELKKKPVYYMKADKGNAVVIMDKKDYDEQMEKKINEGPYRHLRVDPLPGLIRLTDKTLKDCKPIIGEARLKEANPILPRIKGLPKIHKPGQEMREIISAEGSPTHKLAKWLVQEFQSMPKPFPTSSVKNTQEFTQKLLESGTIEEDEIMVSFDVAALFPSVPVKDALNLLEDWLLPQKSDAAWKGKVRTYLRLARLCMDENYFQFRGQFYKQTKGAPMGNPLSPFLCELFMANLETKLKEQGLLPEKWWRYVDDIFSVIKREALSKVLEVINNVHKDIRFTHEEEKEGKLPFLDLLVKREDSSSFEFEIYRKPTNTMRVIPYSSNHSFQHKMAAFHHMVHRMQTLPLSDDGKNKELTHIFETAKINGYKERTIQAIIDKKERLRYRGSLTTLTPISESLKRVSVPFDQHITNNLRSRFRNFGIDLVFSSRSNQLKTSLGSTKDPVNTLNKAGVYKISCSHCDKVYVGQTKRSLEVRFREHMAEVGKAQRTVNRGLEYDFRSKVAEHVFEEGHPVTTEDIQILRNVTSPWKLDVAESLEIYKQVPNTLLNKDQGNGSSWLFKLLPPKHSRMACVS